MNHKWEDISSYSRNDKERIPSVWQIDIGGLSLCVHRHIHYPKDSWLFSCDLLFDKYELDSKNIDEAKDEAINLVKIKIEHIYNAFWKLGVDKTKGHDIL